MLTPRRPQVRSLHRALKFLIESLTMRTNLNHIAIIPDGNRRWAKAHNKVSWEGHIEGGKRVEEIVKTAVNSGIKYITLWASSYDNLVKRSKEEISAIERIYKELARIADESKDVREKSISIQFIGEYASLLSAQTVEALNRVAEKTKKNTEFLITCLVGYNGNRELLSAIDALRAKKDTITEDDIKSSLWTAKLPPVDLIIRTGNDPHLSNGFMMWDAQNAILHFSEKMWPDFRKEDLEKIIGLYGSKERRFGT